MKYISGNGVCSFSSDELYQQPSNPYPQQPPMSQPPPQTYPMQSNYSNQPPSGGPSSYPASNQVCYG